MSMDAALNKYGSTGDASTNWGRVRLVLAGRKPSTQLGSVRGIDEFDDVITPAFKKLSDVFTPPMKTGGAVRKAPRKAKKSGRK
jgi:hypothetical protein